MNDEIRKAAEEVKKQRDNYWRKRNDVERGIYYLRTLWEVDQPELERAEKSLCTLVIEFLESENQS